MAVYDHQEREQLEDLKAWWTQWGAYVVAAIVAVAVIMLTMTGWRYWQEQKNDAASQLYYAVADSLQFTDEARAQKAMSQMTADYASTGYAPRAALLYAQILWDNGKPDDAVGQLNWVIEHADEAALKDVARYRLASAMVEQKKYDEALKFLATAHNPAFDMLYDDLKGEALMGQGNPGAAVEAFTLALLKLPLNDVNYREVIQSKLDAAIAASGAPAQKTEPAAATTPVNP
jgi:predicted negative regulator of RcsB-dependent stress response